MLLAMLLGQGTHACIRKHRYRQNGQQRVRRLGEGDHLVVWKRPERPKWMDPSFYEQIPKTMELREVCFRIEVPGCRTQVIEVITTLTDADEYSQEDIADSTDSGGAPSWTFASSRAPLTSITFGAGRRRWWRPRSGRRSSPTT